jgi:SAM-dependent methyltransferase
MIRYMPGRYAWATWDDTLLGLVRNPDVIRVCDVGGGANPALDLGSIRRHAVDYVVADISAHELRKAPPGYRTRQVDVASREFSQYGPFDLVISKMLAEHVVDPEAFHRSVYEALAPGGRAVHFFPTLYEPVFVLNRVIPERASGRLLRQLQAGRESDGHNGKFPALYRWCRGPTRRQLSRLRSVGFEVDEYVGFFGHNYFRGRSVLDSVDRTVGQCLVRYPLAAFTSFAIVTLRRPTRGCAQLVSKPTGGMDGRAKAADKAAHGPAAPNIGTKDVSVNA